MDGFAEQTPQPADVVAFGHYRVRRLPDGSLDELGRGAMGVTYRAFDPGLRKQVAIKVIAAAYVHDESTRRRFQREARAAAQLTHPHVAGVLHLGEQGGEFFYAMEFVAGRPLSDLLKQERVLSPVRALALLSQVAAALAAAHKRELIHRDLKPANLMLLEGEAIDHDDERISLAGGRQVKVVDFGLARSFGTSRMEDSLATQSTQSAAFTGTPAYASPEQCAGASELDGRSDLYSLGIILWQCLTGRLPFVGTPVQVLGMQQFQPPPMAQLAGQPLVLVELLGGLLAKDPAERRPATAAELRETMDGLRRKLVSAGEETQGRPDDETRLPDVSASSTLGLGATAREAPMPHRPASAPSAKPAVPPSSPLVSILRVVGLGAVAVGGLWFLRERFLPEPAPAAPRVSATPAAKRTPTPAAAPTPTPAITRAPTAPPAKASSARQLGEKAVEAAGAIKDPSAQALALRFIGESEALADFPEAAGTFSWAREASRGIQDGPERAFVLRFVAKAMRSDGRDGEPRELLMESALVVRDQVNDKTLRNYHFREVAIDQMKAGSAAEAVQTVLMIAEGFHRDSAFGELAAVQARAGNARGALELVQRIADPFWRASALTTVATAQSRAGNPAAARTTLAAIPAEQRRDSQQDEVLGAEVKVQARKGSLAAAQVIESQMRDASLKGVARAELALALARVGDANAGTMFGSAKNAASGASPFAQIACLRDIALLQAEAGMREEARATLLATRGAALALTDAAQRDGSLNLIGIAQAKVGYAEDAEITAGELNDVSWRTGVVTAIVTARAKEGKYDAARDVALQAPARRLQRAHLYFIVAVLQTWSQGPAEVEKWAVGLGDPSERAMAFAGMLNAVSRQKKGQAKFDDEDIATR